MKNGNEAAEFFETYGFPKDVWEIYPAEWFQKFSLAAVILFTSPSYAHCVTEMEISEDLIHICVQEIMPEAVSSLGVYKAILVGIPKEEAPADAGVSVQIETVADGK